MGKRADYAVGLDLGGTRIKGIAVDSEGGVLAEASLPTNDTGDSTWTDQVRAVLKQVVTVQGAPPKWIGLAAPGLPGSDQRSIASMPGRLKGIEGLIWNERLEFRGHVPVLNDAHAALLGEAWLGAARGARDAVLLTLGTGVGGACLVDGKLLRGHLGRAGHLGHISLDPDGEPDIARTPGSLEDAIGECSLTQRSGGRFRTTQELVEQFRAGDAHATEIWLRSVKALAAGVASLINVLDPEVVVLGGGIATAGDALFRPLETELRRFEWQPFGAPVPLRPANLGDRAGAFGAAWYAMRFSTASAERRRDDVFRSAESLKQL